MAIRNTEQFKPIVAIAPQAVNTTNVTGRYMKAGRRNTVYGMVGAMGTVLGTETAIFQVYKATSNIGAGSAVATGIAVTFTTVTDPQEVSILVDTVTNAKYIIINGETYTKAAAYSLPSQEFSNAAELATLINAVDATLYAADSGTAVAVYARELYEVDLTVTLIAGWEAAKLVPTTISGLAVIEFKDSDLGDILGVPYTHFAVRVTTTGSTLAAALAEIDDVNMSHPHNIQFNRDMN